MPQFSTPFRSAFRHLHYPIIIDAGGWLVMVLPLTVAAFFRASRLRNFGIGLLVYSNVLITVGLRIDACIFIAFNGDGDQGGMIFVAGQDNLGMDFTDLGMGPVFRYNATLWFLPLNVSSRPSLSYPSSRSSREASS